MVNENNKLILVKGSRTWNQWRIENPAIKPDLSGVDLCGANLSETNLKDVNLTGAKLAGANLARADVRDANLVGADLRGANLTKSKLVLAKIGRVDLSGAILNRANLTGASLSLSDLSRANLNGANLSWSNLSGVNLSHTNLIGADLSGADLSWANLSEANFEKTNMAEAVLVSAQIFNTNFSSAVLTGICIKDWKIDFNINLDNVVCQYVFLEWDHQERRPTNPNQSFKSGDFARFVTQEVEIFELVFNEGIDWNLFLKSFKKIQASLTYEMLDIQGIEQKNNESLIISLVVPKELNKYQLKASFWKKYQTLLKAEDTSNELLKAEILIKRQQDSQILNIIETMAHKSLSEKLLKKRKKE
ncbi:MAG TPA: pentapeptide repeat-containing protein [Cyanothece sp. UBA12306]|nr:pentapeptide repeat-containing protein [Cyanothece sp. UBA12306]